jgi:aspartate/methionine/tyrosine aminotransferase
VRLISDETHRYLSQAPPPPAASLDPAAVSIGTMSKTYELPGLRIGWIATKDAALIQRLIAVRGAHHQQHARRTHRAGGAARPRAVPRACPRPGTPEQDDRGRAHRQQPAPGPGKSVAGVVGLSWIADADENACLKVYRHLAEDLDALVVPASGFELPGTFFRVGFGGDQDALKRGLERLDTARKILNSDEHTRATAG